MSVRALMTVWIAVSEYFFDPDSDPILAKSRLERGRLTSVNWDRARSGIQLPDDAARELETLWKKHLARIGWGGGPVLPDPITSLKTTARVVAAFRERKRTSRNR